MEWGDAEVSEHSRAEVRTAPGSAACYRRPPADALNRKRYDAWSREFVQWILCAQPLELHYAQAAGINANAGGRR